jgi:hypothetical protein
MEVANMSRDIIFAALGTALVLALNLGANAQGRGARRGVNIENIVTFTGTVTGTNMTPGQQHPSFKMATVENGEVTILAGPNWLVASSDLTLKEGSRLTVKAFASLQAEGTYVAIEIRNEDTGVAINLFTQGGPGFMRRGGFGMQGPWLGSGTGPAAFDLARVVVLTGTVKRVDMDYGKGTPGFVLETAQGPVTVMAGPYWLVARSGFRMSEGETIVVTAFPCLRGQSTYAAMKLVNQTTGATLELRNEVGTPVGGFGGRGLCRIP